MSAPGFRNQGSFLIPQEIVTYYCYDCYISILLLTQEFVTYVFLGFMLPTSNSIFLISLPSAQTLSSSARVV